MSDIILPVFVIVIMLLIIDRINRNQILLIIGSLFIPISWLFIQQIEAGVYNQLFGGDVIVGEFNLIFQIGMVLVPLMAFVKIIYIVTYEGE